MPYQIIQEDSSSPGQRIGSALARGLGGYANQKLSNEAKKLEREKLQAEIDRYKSANKVALFGHLTRLIPKPTEAKKFDNKEYETYITSVANDIKKTRDPDMVPEGAERTLAQMGNLEAISYFGTPEQQVQAYRLMSPETKSAVESAYNAFVSTKLPGLSRVVSDLRTVLSASDARVLKGDAQQYDPKYKLKAIKDTKDAIANMRKEYNTARGTNYLYRFFPAEASTAVQKAIDRADLAVDKMVHDLMPQAEGTKSLLSGGGLGMTAGDPLVDVMPQGFNALGTPLPAPQGLGLTRELGPWSEDILGIGNIGDFTP